MSKNNLKGKKVLITGISGFVGGALSRHLNSLGAIVYGISRSINNDKKKLKNRYSELFKNK